MKKIILKRWLLFVPGIITIILVKYGQRQQEWVERGYSSKLYPLLEKLVGFLPAKVSFSITEVLLVLAVFLFLGSSIYSLRKIIVAKAGQGWLFYRSVVNALVLASLVFFLFTLLGGLNYYRAPFSKYTSYDTSSGTKAELEQLCLSLANDLNQKRLTLPKDIYQSEKFSEYGELAIAGMKELAKDYPILKREFYSPPKKVFLSEIMSQAGISGVFFPFTMESNVNQQIPFYLIPVTMAHELTHQVGFMREDEANFIAYLACQKSPDSLLQYSGLSLAFNYAISALNRIDSAKATKIKNNLTASVQKDRQYNAKYLADYNGAFYHFFTKVNDSYLKFNQQIEGVASYGGMVTLLIAEQREK